MCRSWMMKHTEQKLRFAFRSTFSIRRIAFSRSTSTGNKMHISILDMSMLIWAKRGAIDNRESVIILRAKAVALLLRRTLPENPLREGRPLEEEYSGSEPKRSSCRGPTSRLLWLNC